MEARSRTEAEYIEAVSQIVRYVFASWGEVVLPRQLANLAGFSPHHFHRVFRAVTGESVMDFVRRVRLERAALTLRTSDEPVGSAAFEAGYGSQEAFGRAFVLHYGVNPTEFRRARLSHRLPCASGVHFQRDGIWSLSRVADPEMLSHEGLCEFHRQWPDRFESQWEELMSVLTGFSAFVYPPPLEEFTMLEALTDVDREIEALEKDVEAAKQRLIDARRRRPKEQVRDYELRDPEGNVVHLSQLFGDKEDLIVIHNMGTGCSSCTMWADGFNGLSPHLMDRAAFVVCAPDKPEVMKRFAAKRHWQFPMASAYETTFFQDMGFWGKGPWPGVSTFHREPDGSIVRVGKAVFDAGDDFCAVWPLIELLDGGTKGWMPKFAYGDSGQ